MNTTTEVKKKEYSAFMQLMNEVRDLSEEDCERVCFFVQGLVAASLVRRNREKAKEKM